MKYENMEVESKRGKIETKISSLLSYTFKVFGISKDEIFTRLDDLIMNIDNIFLTETPEMVQKLLGGEFNKDIIYLGGDFFPEKSSIPLYFSLELLIKSLESNFLNKTNYNDDLIDRLRKLNELKEKASELEFNPIFNPNDELDNYTMENIISSKGKFDLGMHINEGIKYLGVITHWSHTPGYEKNGDYYQTGPTTKGSSKPMTLYKKDSDAIKNEKIKKTKINFDKLQRIAKKYFIDEKIPTVHNFHINLKDSQMDERLRVALFGLCDVKAFNDYERADKAVYEINQLEKIEQVIEQEKIEKEITEAQRKKTAIQSAKERYNSKNFFWKFMNRKITPQNQNFGDMTTEEIEKLYVGRSK